VTHYDVVELNLVLSVATEEEIAVLERFLKRKVVDVGATVPANDTRAA